MPEPATFNRNRLNTPTDEPPEMTPEEVRMILAPDGEIGTPPADSDTGSSDEPDA